MIAGLTHWRLHLVVLASTFALFPLLGLAIQHLPPFILPGVLALRLEATGTQATPLNKPLTKGAVQ